MIKLLNLDHVAIAVRHLDSSIEEYSSKYGVSPLHREVVAEQGVEEVMLAIGGSFIQLVQPLTADSPVGRFIERNGEGLHHVAYAVANIDDSLAHLQAAGARLIDSTARRGGRGTRIAFVHPKDLAGTLVELVELPLQ